MADFMSTAWHVDPVFLVGFVAVAGGYAAAARPADSRTALWFAGGLALLLLAVTSPLDALAAEYLLSAHMVQHLLLSQVIPPMLLLGLPATVVIRALGHPGVAAVERQIRRPLVAWSAGIGTLWLWHVPAMFDLAANHAIGHLHHLSVLVAGLVFWWPVLAPVRPARMEALPAVAYLATACLASTVLGMALTFAPETVYATYRQPADGYAILAGLRSAGLTPAADQQLAGLIMWVPCCLLYLGGIAAVVLRWYGEGDRMGTATALTPGPSPARGRGEPRPTNDSNSTGRRIPRRIGIGSPVPIRLPSPARGRGAGGEGRS